MTDGLYIPVWCLGGENFASNSSQTQLLSKTEYQALTASGRRHPFVFELMELLPWRHGPHGRGGVDDKNL